MINFRYHVVTLTAVFLALGLGILLGSTFLDRTFVDALDTQVSRLERRVVAKGAEIDSLTQQLQAGDAMDQAMLESGIIAAVGAPLTGTDEVVIASRGTDEDLVKTVTQAVAAGGGRVPFVMWLEEPFDLSTDEGAVSVLQDLEGAGVSLASADELLTAIAAELRGDGPDSTTVTTSTTAAGASGPSAAQVSGASGPADALGSSGSGPSGVVTSTSTVPGNGSGTTDAEFVPVLDALDRAGLVTIENANGGDAAALIVPNDARLLMLSGEGQVIDPSAAALPIAESFASAGEPRMVIGSALRMRSSVDLATDPKVPDRATVIAPYRDDERLDGKASTIDNVENPSGLVALVVSLAQLEDGLVGDYGIAAGASQPVPEPVP